jgi:hypothetical protein
VVASRLDGTFADISKNIHGEEKNTVFGRFTEKLPKSLYISM